jgi:ribosome biogenesis GTPase A/gas vesicle protein
MTDEPENTESPESEAETLFSTSSDEIEEWFLELSELADDSGLHSLQDEILNEQLPAFRQGEMSVVVLGEFNHGKSTVINALLGESILPVGITPTTSHITHLVHGDEPSAAVQQPRGGDKIDVEYGEVDKLIEDIEESDETPEYVEIAYPNNLLRDSLVLVDTPGVNDISRQKVEITYGYLPKSDLIIYVLDSTQVLKKSEIAFIEDRLLRANLDRVIFVLGKTDALEDEDIDEVREYTRNKLDDLVGEDAPLFAFSATEALEAQESDSEPPEEFTDFRNYLMRFLREQRGEILFDSALGGGLRIAGLMEQNLAVKKQSYLLEKEELEERIAKVHDKLEESQELIAQNIDLIDERIGEISSTARHNLENFTEEFKETLPQQIERADAKDVKLYLSSWIQDSFRDWLEDEGERVAARLEELAEEVIEITNRSLREALDEVQGQLGLREQLDLDVDTVAYDMSVFALGSLGVSAFFFANAIIGGLLTLSTPVLAVVLKGKVDEKIKEQAKKEGIAAIDEAQEEIERELIHIIRDYGERLKEFVESAGDRLYQQIEEVLRQVQSDVNDDLDREELAEEVEEQIEAIREVAGKFEDARQELKG